MTLEQTVNDYHFCNDVERFRISYNETYDKNIFSHFCNDVVCSFHGKNLAQVKEPQSLKEASQHIGWKEANQAMDNKLKAIDDNETWEMTDFVPGKQAIAL